MEKLNWAIDNFGKIRFHSAILISGIGSIVISHLLSPTHWTVTLVFAILLWLVVFIPFYLLFHSFTDIVLFSMKVMKRKIETKKHHKNVFFHFTKEEKYKIIIALLYIAATSISVLLLYWLT